VSIPVIMYHHVLPKRGFIASSLDEFEEQMNFLAKNNWKTLTSDEFYLFKKGELSLPKKSVLITFDDGWRDNFIYAYPILKKYNLRATLFIITEWIEKASSDIDYEFFPLGHNACKKAVAKEPRKVLCTWEELKNMQDVFDIHIHTHTHRDEYFTAPTWKEEFINSRELFKQKMGKDDHHLCWPRGYYTSELIQEALKENFDIFYTTKRGINKPDNKLLEIKRMHAKKGKQWLRKNLFLFSNNFLGSIYSKIKQ
jgi:peptidoglycan/xylan/chitin deacetylase (PgdA/CDA1 family)